MKRIASVVLFGLLVFPLCIGGEKQKIILDCDLGGDIDDAFGVAMMLTAQDGFVTQNIEADLSEGENSLLIKMLDTPNNNTMWAGISLRVLN